MVTDARGPDIEELLAAATANPEMRPAFLTALMDLEVHVLGELDEEGRAALRFLGGPDGPVLPFFTSEAMARETLAAIEATDEAPYLVLPCRSLWELTAGATLVLNPHGTHAKIFTPDEVEQLLTDGVAPAARRRRRFLRR